MKKVMLLLLIIIATSCTSMLLNSALKDIGAFDDKVTMDSLSNGEKEVAFINMHHVGREEFYRDAAFKIDSLQNLDYMVFYESVIEEKNTDSIVKDHNERKIRKILGFIPEEHLDTVNNRLFGKYKYSGTYDLINQPDYHRMNVDTTTAVKADVSLNTLIEAFEKKHAQIELNNCDMDLSLSSTSYNCERASKSVQKAFMDEFIMDFRNAHLAKLIHHQKRPKIAVIFGKAHLSGMVVELRKLDSNWAYK